MPNDGQPETPRKSLERSFVWFSLGLLVMGGVGAIAGYNWLQGLIDEGVNKRVLELQTGAQVDLGALARELARNHADELRGPAGPQGESGEEGRSGIAEMPAGAVVAFASECPTGWVAYRMAAGRFVVGIDDGLPLLSTGGEAEVTLTVAQMPRHGHDAHQELFRYLDEETGEDNGIPIWYLVDSPSKEWLGIRGFEVTRTNEYYDFGGSALTGSWINPVAGSDQPHNNMPPYIALYWCTPEAG